MLDRAALYRQVLRSALTRACLRKGREQPEAIADEMRAAGFKLVDRIQPWFGNTFCLVFERPRDGGPAMSAVEHEGV